MESSFNQLICSFESEWKFNKADLMDLKENERLSGKFFYAYNIPGLRYLIRIYLKGSGDQGKIWIYLYLDGLEQRKIVANYTVSFESANFSKDFDLVYENYSGWGTPLFLASEFFDSQNKFFVNGEVTIKIKGTFKTQRLKITKVTTPISMEWKIKEADLKAKIEALKYRYLSSEEKTVSTFSDVKYHLSVYPKKVVGENEPKTVLCLDVKIGNEKKIEAFFDFAVNSVNIREGIKCVIEKSVGCAISLCSSEDLFDPTKKFIVDGFFTVNLNGILMVEKSQYITLNCKNGVAPKSAFKSDDKDFTIVIGEKEIKVHKNILIDASPVLAGMFESGMKEATENKMIIEDFDFKTVDIAVKLLYGISILLKHSLETLLSLYQFGDKYRIGFIMDLIEEYLIKEISPSNVVHLIKFSAPDSFNVKKLQQKCIDFMIKCVTEKTPVYASESLDKEFLSSLVLKALCPNVDTVTKV